MEQWELRQSVRSALLRRDVSGMRAVVNGLPDGVGGLGLLAEEVQLLDRDTRGFWLELVGLTSVLQAGE